MGSILMDFEKRMERRQYISAALFRKVQKRAPEQIPKQFDLDEYNDRVLEVEYTKTKDYFDHILDDVSPTIKLDKEQAKAILADEDRELIIAGAGTGKTTTMTAKVKYLVDKKHIAPEDILVMSYTKRDVEDLRETINEALKIPADVTTFHSLGFRYIKQTLRYKNCYAVGENERSKIFLKYLKKRIMTNYEKIEDFLESFNADATGRKGLVGSYFRENYGRFKNFDDYFDHYVKKKLSEAGDKEALLKRTVYAGINADEPRTLLGERVKSKGEAIIANWLYRHSINYEYEQIFDELLPDTNSYRPDFTLNIGGQKIYVEYFGMSNSDEKGNYDKIRKIKEEFHRKNYTNFIALDYEPNYGYLKTLHKKLEEFGVRLPRERSAKEVYEAVVRHNPLAEFFKLQEFFYDIIDTVKVSLRRNQFDEIIEDYLEDENDLDKRVLLEKQYKYIRDFYIFYSSEIHRDTDKLGFDFADMIYYAKIFISRMNEDAFHYKYIVIDEYQDISLDRYELASDMMKRSKAKLVAVGDDWQTIYSFAGSRIEYIYNFRSYFEDAKTFKITKTYRNPQSLIDIAGDFIMKNPDQIRKELKSATKDINDPFVFLNFKGSADEDALSDEFKKTKQAVLSIHQQRPNDKIVILARTNATLNAMLKSDAGFKDEIGTKVSLAEAPGFKFDAMTIHKAKGITADWVIVIGLNKNFPNKSRPAFWLLRLFMNLPKEEKISFAEERRVFYVALTRARYKVILLRNTQASNRSTFLNEIYEAMRS